MLTLTQFINKYLGTKVDFDGQYGYQCVDLYRQYCKDVLNIPQTPSVEGAKDIIKHPGSLLVTKENTLADYSRGDILIWGATKNNKHGHVAILVDVYNTKYFIVLEQDGIRQNGVKLAFRSRENLLGCLYKLP